MVLQWFPDVLGSFNNKSRWMGEVMDQRWCCSNKLGLGCSKMFPGVGIGLFKDMFPGAVQMC